MARTRIPDYFVYGEPARLLDIGFVHVELISARKNLHRGKVEAHQHAQMAQITFWTKGGGIYTIEEQSWTFSAPAISFVPSGVVHEFSVSEQSDAIVLSIANDAIQDIMSRSDAAKPGAMFLPNGSAHIDWQDVKSVMQLALKDYQLQRPHAQNLITHLAAVAFDLMARDARTNGPANPQPTSALAQCLRYFIDQHFRETLPVSQYASRLNTTYHLLDKAARDSFGKPVKQLIVERRMLEAKRLLRFTIRSAESIAYELGYDDPAYFNRQFKAATGFAPGRWRASQPAT